MTQEQRPSVLKSVDALDGEYADLQPLVHLAKTYGIPGTQAESMSEVILTDKPLGLTIRWTETLLPTLNTDVDATAH